MKIKKVGKLLRKINNLYENIKEEGSVSRMERDLFLSYLKDMYENTLADEEIVHGPIDKVASAEVEKVLQPHKEVSVHEPKITDSLAQVEQPKTPSMQPSASESNEQEISAPDKSPATATVPVEPEVLSVPDVSEEMKDLFEEIQISEVSDRLSMSPIADLTKAMGINEKIFTVRELFNKDQDKFNETIRHLNDLSTFDEAKSYLMHGVAKDFGWDEADMQKKAFNFIKLVQRRFR